MVGQYNVYWVDPAASAFQTNRPCHQVKTQYLHFNFHANCFLLPWKIQCSTKGSIYHIKHMYIQPFTKVVDWPEIRCLMEVHCIYYVLCFYLGRQFGCHDSSNWYRIANTSFCIKVWCIIDINNVIDRTYSMKQDYWQLLTFTLHVGILFKPFIHNGALYFTNNFCIACLYIFVLNYNNDK